MKSGKMIDIDQMNENHLRNVLKMILRTKEPRVYTFKTSQKDDCEEIVVKSNSLYRSRAKFGLNGDMANEFNENYSKHPENYNEEDDDPGLCGNYDAGDFYKY